MASRQLLIFRLDKETFGVDIAQVDQIIPPKEVTKIPNTPDFIEGLLNLRGKVFTIFNLKKRFNLPDHEFNENTKIVIANVGSITAGFIVDEVSQIIRIEEDSIEAAPRTITSLNQRYMGAVAKSGDKLVIILDLNEVFSVSSEDNKSKAII